uniref:Uncharacterized protein n=1 Tax=Arundo donax TaxID=35708 RepID=A0A0A9EVK5_ARUDO
MKIGKSCRKIGSLKCNMKKT